MKSLLTIAIMVAGIALGQAEEKTCAVSESCGLQGKPKVRVVVSKLHEELERAGISEAGIKTEVELLLRKFGVPVVKEDGAAIFLSVMFEGYEIQIAPDRRGVGQYYYAYSCNAMQTVRLDRKPSIVVVGATTWTSGIGVSYMNSPKSLRDSISDTTQQITKAFINAYLEANPK